MIALDTSSFVAYLSGESGADTDAVEIALARRQACLPPAVLAEFLSDPVLLRQTAALFRTLPRLDVTDGYWERVGALRADVIALGRKARLADALIAQSCLDHDVPLVTRDADFQNFAKVRPLRLILAMGLTRRRAAARVAEGEPRGLQEVAKLTGRGRRSYRPHPHRPLRPARPPRSPRP